MANNNEIIDEDRRKFLEACGVVASSISGCLTESNETDPNQEGNYNEEDTNSNTRPINNRSSVEAERVNAWEDFEVTEEGKVEPLPFIAYNIANNEGKGAYRGHAHAPRERVSVIQSWVAIDGEIKDFSEFDDITAVDSAKPIADNLVPNSRYMERGPNARMVMPEKDELEQIIVGFEVMRPENSSLEYSEGEYIITIDPDNLADIQGEKQQYLDDLENYTTGDGLLGQNYHNIVG